MAGLGIARKEAVGAGTGSGEAGKGFGEATKGLIDALTELAGITKMPSAGRTKLQGRGSSCL